MIPLTPRRWEFRHEWGLLQIRGARDVTIIIDLLLEIILKQQVCKKSNLKFIHCGHWLVANPRLERTAARELPTNLTFIAHSTVKLMWCIKITTHPQTNKQTIHRRVGSNCWSKPSKSSIKHQTCMSSSTSRKKLNSRAFHSSHKVQLRKFSQDDDFCFVYDGCHIVRDSSTASKVLNSSSSSPNMGRYLAIRTSSSPSHVSLSANVAQNDRRDSRARMWHEKLERWFRSWDPDWLGQAEDVEERK